MNDRPNPGAALPRGPTPMSPYGVPRYCGTIWTSALNARLADATRAQIANAIERFYRFADGRPQPIDLDLALFEGDLDTLETLLTGYLLLLGSAGVPGSTAARRNWARVLSFVTGILAHNGYDEGKEALGAKLRRIHLLYAQLSPTRPRGPAPIRALPPLVLEELYGIFHPEGELNPFRTERCRWRNFLAFMLLLHLGLRAGELLALRVDEIRDQFDPGAGETRFWLCIVEPQQELDPRARPASVKTEASIRELPLPREIGALVGLYLQQFRGDPPHDYLLSSAEEAPLAPSSLALVLKTASACLSKDAIELLKPLGRGWVAPHDLRHTAAVIRLQRYREQGISQDLASEKLRPFFGWSRNSSMPFHYARAYYEPKHQEIWEENFAAVLRAIRGASGGQADV